MSKSIVHIATDEKFINAAYDIYEKAFPKENRFLILIPSKDYKVKYLAKDKAFQFLIESDFATIISEVADSKIVIFHGLDYRQAQIVPQLSQDKTLVWTVFGAEVYSNPLIIGKEIYGKETYQNYVFSLKRLFKDKFRGAYYKYKQKAPLPATIGIKAMKRMDIVGVLYAEEFELYQSKIGLKTTMQQFGFTYYPLDTVIPNSDEVVNGNNILLGNSASFSNNHLEAFGILKKLNLKTNKIITPLSYGREEYAADITKKGEELFGDNFLPLIDFLPLQEYQKILQGCGIVIMNHYRQQAVGNVLNAMYLGAKVYLSNKSTLFFYLKRIGCFVCCVEEDLNPENKQVLVLLTIDQQQTNRRILKNELSLTRICKELQDTLNPILN